MIEVLSHLCLKFCIRQTLFYLSSSMQIITNKQDGETYSSSKIRKMEQNRRQVPSNVDLSNFWMLRETVKQSIDFQIA
jgi:hypothetical protein